jgi:hypothetical protein
MIKESLTINHSNPPRQVMEPGSSLRMTTSRNISIAALINLIQKNVLGSIGNVKKSKNVL